MSATLINRSPYVIVINDNGDFWVRGVTRIPKQLVR